MDEIQKKRVMAAVAVFAWFAQAVYILFPFDLLPDFIPVIGWIDDLLAFCGLLATTLWMVRTVKEAGVHELLDLAPERPAERHVYEPIPTEVLRSM